MESHFDLVVDGSPFTVDVDGDTTLLSVLRETLGLSETRFMCRGGLCGTCAVKADGSSLLACVTEVRHVAGMSIDTTKKPLK